MLPKINSLIEWLNEEETVMRVDRILHYDPASETFVLIDVFSKKPLPEFQSAEVIRASLENKKARILEKDPFSHLFIEKEITKNHCLKRDAAWETIASIVEAGGMLPYFKETRGQLVTEASKKTGTHKKVIYERLRRYWQAGQCKNALRPNYLNCGTNSAWRKETGKYRKVGRPSLRSKKENKIIGIIITPEIKRKFERGIKKYYQTQERRNLRWAYRRTLNEFFHHGYEFKGKVAVPVLPPAEQLPSFRQFYYWYEKDFRNIRRELTARMGKRDFETNHRALLGNSTAMAFGPGSLYQVDATIGDIYLVSEFLRTRIIGRPVIYFVIDVFSRYLLGIAVTLEGPSWLGAMLALDNIVADKVAFCAEHDIAITPEQWNCVNFPEGILGDRGEFEGYSVESLVNNMGIIVKNAPPYRADFKGIVERAFGKANEKFIHFLPGAVAKKRARGERDYRLDAVLTLKEFRALLIQYVLNYNASHYLSYYNPDEFLIEDAVDLYPQDLWNWGIRNRSGHLRVFPRDVVRLNLLPRKMVSITRHGIHFEHDLYYTCDLAREEGWFERAGQRGSWKVEAAYDVRDLSNIYLPMNGGREIVTCRLTPAAQLFQFRDWHDAADYFASKTIMRDENQTRILQTDAEFEAIQQNIVTEAEKKTITARRAAGNQSKASQTQNIRSNRAEEREMERRLQAFDLSGGNEKPNQDEKPNTFLSTEANVEAEDEGYVPGASKIRRIRELTKKKLG